MVKITLNLNIRRSIIPPRGGIPPSAGLARVARSAYSPKRVVPTVGHTIAKASKPSFTFTVKPDSSLIEETEKWGEK